MSSQRPLVSVGVITHERATAFGKLLQHLKPVFQAYEGTCEFIVANNSGTAARPKIDQIVEKSGILDAVKCTIVDSTENNIAVGRNIILDNAHGELIAFIDDDEYPSTDWLESLVHSVSQLNCAIIAGPIIPVFGDDAKGWVRQVDIHNTQNLSTGDRVAYAASGNFLISKEALGSTRFDPAFGKSGGEDTEFFLRLRDQGATIKWCKEAVVYEDIPPEKANTKYMLRRFISQGAIYKNIMTMRGDIKSHTLFVVRAFLLSIVSLAVGSVLIVLRHKSAGNWIKRAFSNLGKFYKPGRHLYG